MVCADEHNYVSYLAMKATEVFVKSEGLEDEKAVNDVSDMIIDTFTNLVSIVVIQMTSEKTNV